MNGDETKQIADHIPLIIGATAVAVGSIIVILRSWQAIIDQFKSIVKDMMEKHEAKENGWQDKIDLQLDHIEDRLRRIERKMDGEDDGANK